jgi:hypothetical protein
MNTDTLYYVLCGIGLILILSGFFAYIKDDDQ